MTVGAPNFVNEALSERARAEALRCFIAATSRAETLCDLLRAVAQSLRYTVDVETALLLREVDDGLHEYLCFVRKGLAQEPAILDWNPLDVQAQRLFVMTLPRAGEVIIEARIGTWFDLLDRQFLLALRPWLELAIGRLVALPQGVSMNLLTMPEDFLGSVIGGIGQFRDHFRLALTNDQLRLVAQPIYAVHGGAPIHWELLSRWVHPLHGELNPEHFCSWAETSGVIADLTQWLLRQVGLLHRDMASPPCVAINVSPLEFRSPHFVERFLQSARRHQIRLDCLYIEVTEALTLSLHDELLADMRCLVDAGVRIAVDDFGVGYSSLAYLVQLPVSMIKLDKQLIDRVVVDSKARSVVGCVIALAHELGILVVAEGVESSAQSLCLQELGCDLLQGFLLSGPVELTAMRGMV